MTLLNKNQIEHKIQKFSNVKSSNSNYSNFFSKDTKDQSYEQINKICIFQIKKFEKFTKFYFPKQNRKKSLEIKNFVCRICGKIYISNPALYTHRRNKHNIISITKRQNIFKIKDNEGNKIKYNYSNIENKLQTSKKETKSIQNINIENIENFQNKEYLKLMEIVQENLKLILYYFNNDIQNNQSSLKIEEDTFIKILNNYKNNTKKLEIPNVYSNQSQYKVEIYEFKGKYENIFEKNNEKNVIKRKYQNIFNKNIDLNLENTKSNIFFDRSLNSNSDNKISVNSNNLPNEIIKVYVNESIDEIFIIYFVYFSRIIKYDEKLINEVIKILILFREYLNIKSVVINYIENIIKYNIEKFHIIPEKKFTEYNYIRFIPDFVEEFLQIILDFIINCNPVRNK